MFENRPHAVERKKLNAVLNTFTNGIAGDGRERDQTEVRQVPRTRVTLSMPFTGAWRKSCWGGGLWGCGWGGGKDSSHQQTHLRQVAKDGDLTLTDARPPGGHPGKARSCT